MSKFKHEYDGFKLTYECSHVGLDEILESFSDFLKGCGFC